MDYRGGVVVSRFAAPVVRYAKALANVVFAGAPIVTSIAVDGKRSVCLEAYLQAAVFAAVPWAGT
jgi:hypothetical protein